MGLKKKYVENCGESTATLTKVHWTSITRKNEASSDAFVHENVNFNGTKSSLSFKMSRELTACASV